MLPFIESNNVLTFYCEDISETITIAPDHPKYDKVRENIKDIESGQQLKEMMLVPSSVSNYVSSETNNKHHAEIKDGKVYLNGNIVKNVIAEKIIDFMMSSLPFEPLLRFLENLSDNPSNNSVEQLYDFLSNKNLPITEDGCFLAYKAVSKDYTDKWTGEISNKPGGSIPKLNRNQVNDNPSISCGSGYHVGALEYVSSYGHGDDKAVIVKINPADVVSVPTDSGCQKCRVVFYEVVKEYEGTLINSLYTSLGNEIKKFIQDWKEDDLDEYEDNYADENTASPNIYLDDEDDEDDSYKWN